MRWKTYMQYRAEHGANHTVIHTAEDFFSRAKSHRNRTVKMKAPGRDGDKTFRNLTLRQWWGISCVGPLLRSMYPFTTPCGVLARYTTRLLNFTGVTLSKTPTDKCRGTKPGQHFRTRNYFCVTRQKNHCSNKTGNAFSIRGRARCRSGLLRRNTLFTATTTQLKCAIRCGTVPRQLTESKAQTHANEPR